MVSQTKTILSNKQTDTEREWATFFICRPFSFIVLYLSTNRTLMAEIVLNRQTYTSQSTIGVLTYGDKKTCFTLEDVCRDKNLDGDLDDAGEAKVKHETAIPAGRYKVIVTYSNRFKKPLPLLVDVKGFDGIRIHSGNTKADTSGCILVGLTKGDNAVYSSRDAFKLFFEYIQTVIGKEDIYIKIVDKKDTTTKPAPIA